MKNIITLCIACIIVLGIGSCSKNTCNDVSAPNYGQDGTCTDLTTNIVGTYNGSFQDSTIGVASTESANQTVIVTKLDDSHIQFSPSNNQFFPFSASLTAGSNSSVLINISSGTYQGQAYVGLPITTSGVTSNGAFNSNTLQLASFISISGGTSMEVFLGTR